MVGSVLDVAELVVEVAVIGLGVVFTVLVLITWVATGLRYRSIGEKPIWSRHPSRRSRGRIYALVTARTMVR